MFKRLDENKGKLVWRTWFILLVELLGTFALVFEIIAPNTFHLSNNDIYNQIFGTYIMKAFWVAGFIWILVMLLRKVSVNLNPVVTLAEIIEGNDSVTLGLAKIFIQFVGGFAAAFAAYFIAQSIGTWEAGISTMDAVSPVLKFSDIEQNLFGLQANYASLDFLVLGTTTGITAMTWVYSIVPFFLEALYTFILLISIFWGKNVGENARAFLIAAAVQVVVTLGISTENIALNPARLLAPAVVSTAMGGAQTMQYQVIFLAGELAAVMIFWLYANKANKKEGKTVPAITKQYKVVAGEMLAYKARYEWVSAGNKRLEDMKKDELLKASKKLKMVVSEEETRDDLEYQILETLIFGLEGNDKVSEKDKIKELKEKVATAPVVKEEPKKAPAKKPEPKKEPVKKVEPAKKPAPKPAPVKKAEPAKKPVAKPAPVKPAQPKLTKEEIAKRDAMRAAAKAKLAKTMEGDSKISLEQIKKLKLTDIFGVGVKTQEYFIENGITDMVKLSNKDVTKLTKKFIEGLPALRSFTYEMKEAKLHSIFEEAKHVVNELKNIK